MKSYFRDALLDANGLSDQKFYKSTRPCKLCAQESHHFCLVDFNKSCNNSALSTTNIGVEYFKCANCELIFTDFFDDWTDEDFKLLVYNDNYLQVDPEFDGTRSTADAAIFAAVCEPCKGLISLLDYGGGMAGFAQEMVRQGYAGAQSYDPYAKNQNLSAETFDVVTAFEVIEHSTTPEKTIDEIMEKVSVGGIAIIGQTVQPDNIDEIRQDWWYIAPRNGHVTFYSHKTLLEYAQSRDLVYRNMGGWFVFHRAELSENSKTIIGRLPAPVQFLRLGAPDSRPFSLGEWHGLEHERDRMFRWTSVQEAPLGEIFFETGTTFVTLPYHMAVNGSILDNSFLKIGGNSFNLRAKSSNNLVAHVQLAQAGLYHVTLATPALQSPAELGLNGDQRKLGIAIFCTQ